MQSSTKCRDIRDIYDLIHLMSYDLYTQHSSEDCEVILVSRARSHGEINNRAKKCAEYKQSLSVGVFGKLSLTLTVP